MHSPPWQVVGNHVTTKSHRITTNHVHRWSSKCCGWKFRCSVQWTRNRSYVFSNWSCNIFMFVDVFESLLVGEMIFLVCEKKYIWNSYFVIFSMFSFLYKSFSAIVDHTIKTKKDNRMGAQCYYRRLALMVNGVHESNICFSVQVWISWPLEGENIYHASRCFVEQIFHAEVRNEWNNTRWGVDRPCFKRLGWEMRCISRLPSGI